MELHEEAPSLDETMYPLDGSFLEVSMEETDSSETFDCDICGRTYKSKVTLKRHLKK